MPIVKTCIICNEIFKVPPIREGQKVCSRKCFLICRKEKSVNRKGIHIPCPICKKVFFIQDSLISIRKTCSLKCKKEFISRRKKETLKKKEAICPVCSEKFIRAHLKNPEIHCSKKCSRIGNRKRITINCAYCNKKMNLPKSRKHRKFCNNHCYHRYRGESSYEKRVRKIFEELGIIYLREVKFDNYSIDFVIRKNIAIEVDGEYWHNKKNVRKRDEKKDKLLIKKGFKVIRLMEKDIEKNLIKKIIEGVVECVEI